MIDVHAMHAVMQSSLVPLHVACDMGNENIAQLLIQNGADVNIATTVSFVQVSKPCVRIVIGQLELYSQEEWTPLMKASFNGSDKIVEQLIAGGVDLNLRNKVSLLSLRCTSKKS